MAKLRVHAYSVSLDGFGAGPDQSLENPLGVGAMALHEWIFGTRTFQAMIGREGGSTGIDDAFAARGFQNIGAWILGRNMFAHSRGDWQDDGWQGWWGDNPPFHTPVIVLTHHPRPPLSMNGGTTFHFVDAEPAEALEQARALAGDLDVRIGGGVTTIRRFLEADLIDQMHIVLVPILLGRGERLWDGLEGLEQRFHIEAAPSPSGVIHLTFARRARRV